MDTKYDGTGVNGRKKSAIFGKQQKKHLLFYFWKNSRILFLSFCSAVHTCTIVTKEFKNLGNLSREHDAFILLFDRIALAIDSEMISAVIQYKYHGHTKNNSC